MSTSPPPIQFTPDTIFSLVKRIVFLRHGNAEPLSDGIDDNSRPLSDLGLCQAVHVREKILECGPFDLILSSPATRARRTAMYALGILPYKLIDEPLLGTEPPGSENPIILAEFNRLGHAPLSQYIGGPATLPLFLLGRRAILGVLGHAKRMDVDHPLTIMCAGHGVLLPAAALALSNELDGTPASKCIRDAVVEITMGEAHAIEITLTGDTQNATVVVHTP